MISTTRRKEDYDGGELLFDVIFGVKFFPTLNEEQASYIMNINNWNKSTIDFRREIMATPRKTAINCDLIADFKMVKIRIDIKPYFLIFPKLPKSLCRAYI